MWVIEDIERMSGGRLKFDVSPPGAIVAPFEQLDACSDGVIDVSFSWSGYWMGKNSALALVCSLPGGNSGFDPLTFQGWMWEGGGLELYQGLYDKMGYKVKVFPTQTDYIEPLGWFNREIKSLEDFKGMKFRAGGLGAEVYKEMGMTVVTVPGGEVVPSLEKKLIDGAEWSDPWADSSLGFQDVVKYYHMPGAHQMAATTEVLFNKDIWNSLPDDLQAIIEVGCRGRLVTTWAMAMAKFRGYMEKLQTENGVTIVETPEEIILETLKAWDRVAEREYAANPDFAEVYDSQKEFCEDIIFTIRRMHPNYNTVWDYYWGPKK